jgi:predicted aspartyl protease
MGALASGAPALAADAPMMGALQTAPIPTPLPAGLPDPATGAPADPANPDKLALGADNAARMTIPVMVNGQGPFPFVIDTGADRTVISKELAVTLNLPKGPDVLLHESAGVDTVETAMIDRLDVGKRTVEHIDAPLISASTLGAAGLLGIDSLRDQHVTLDFRDQKLLSSDSRTEMQDPYTIVVRGKSRFGQLVLVDAVVRGIPVYVILDSGAQNTVGNAVLRRLLTRGDIHHDGHPPTKIISVTGRTTPAEFEDISEMKVGGLTIRNLPLAFAELHTFERFGLTDRPAMLLGMDVLGLCERVTVDFKRREATFTIN